jgi:hypothetical protein
MENEYLRMTYTAVATIDPIAREEKTDILEKVQGLIIWPELQSFQSKGKE